MKLEMGCPVCKIRGIPGPLPVTTDVGILSFGLSLGNFLAREKLPPGTMTKYVCAEHHDEWISTIEQIVRTLAPRHGN